MKKLMITILTLIILITLLKVGINFNNVKYLNKYTRSNHGNLEKLVF